MRKQHTTLAIIKPDAVRAKHVGTILASIEKQGYTIPAMRMTSLSQSSARAFYQTHQGTQYYERLCQHMTTGPIVPLAIQKENAIADFEILKEQIRKQLATSRVANAIHGADAEAAAVCELSFFFPELVTQLKTAQPQTPASPNEAEK